MGIFRRVSDIISANLNDLVDKFEDPEKVLKQAIREMEESIEEATAAAAKAIASERLLAKEFAAHEQQAAEWHERAEQAVRANDDDLARQALKRKHEHDKLAGALKDQLASAQATGLSLRRQVEAMRAKHAEAKRKLATLTARNKAAHARKQLLAVGATVERGNDAFTKFDRMREKVEESEAEADALALLHASPSDVAAEAADLREESLRVEAELAALKQKVRG